MGKISTCLKMMEMIVLRPRLLFSIYDSPLNNYLYEDVRELYFRNKIKEYLIEEILHILKLKKPKEIDVNYFKDNRDGSVGCYELKVLSILVKASKAKNIFEISTGKGRSTFNLAKNSNSNSVVYSINLPQKECKFEIGKLFKNTKYKEKIIQIYADSTKYDFSKIPIKIDFIFIDGAHNYSSVKKDSNNALKILSQKGIIIWDDVGLCHLGSTKAVWEFCKENKLKMRLIAGTGSAITWRGYDKA